MTDIPNDWLTRALITDKAEVETWPEWRKAAYRVLQPDSMPTAQLAGKVALLMRYINLKLDHAIKDAVEAGVPISELRLETQEMPGGGMEHRLVRLQPREEGVEARSVLCRVKYATQPVPRFDAVYAGGIRWLDEVGGHAREASQSQCEHDRQAPETADRRPPKP